jgi:hypothetical protein
MHEIRLSRQESRWVATGLFMVALMYAWPSLVWGFDSLESFVGGVAGVIIFVVYVIVKVIQKKREG